ncbi:MAG TPA: copper homeostasis periplasmic binding protein CopC [Rhizomicrobium sp.]|jgi:hypothetical protein|nr:copper homeostasis periplasmic binding protein CopC [Rhizomicrobium sp.]
MRALTVLATLAALSGAAAAHAFLQSAAPAAGENVRAPSRIVLHFSEPLEQSFSAIVVTDEAGHDESTGPITVDGTEMDLPLKPLTPGRYRVSWHAVSVDTHRTEGKYNFLVLP